LKSHVFLEVDAKALIWDIHLSTQSGVYGMTDQEQIAAFLAKHGARKVETGARAYDDRAIYRAQRDGVRALSAASKEADAQYAQWEEETLQYAATRDYDGAIAAGRRAYREAKAR
jgi:hypothetical protein